MSAEGEVRPPGSQQNLTSKVTGQVSAFLSQAKEAGKNALSHAEESKLVQQFKATVIPKQRNSTAQRNAFFGGGWPSDRASSSRHSPAASAGPANESVDALTRLGFSVVAARYALERCHGDRNQAGDWLLDNAHADEVVAAELQEKADSEAAGGMQAGSMARVVGLRKNVHLNGTQVALVSFSPAAGRWEVKAANGGRYAIFPKNLEPLQGAGAGSPARIRNQPRTQAPEPDQEPSAMSSSCLPSSPTPAATQAQLLASLEVDPEVRAALSGLSAAEVQEILGTGQSSSRPRFTPPSRRPAPEDDLMASQEHALAYAKAMQKIRRAVDGSPEVGSESPTPAELHRQWEAEEERLQLREAEQLSRAAALEQKEAEFEATEEVWQSRAAAEIARLQTLESQCSALETDLRQHSTTVAPLPVEPLSFSEDHEAEQRQDPAELQLLQAELISMNQELDERRHLAHEAQEEQQVQEAALEALGRRHAAELAACEAAQLEASAHAESVPEAQEQQAPKGTEPTEGSEVPEAEFKALQLLQAEIISMNTELEEKRKLAQEAAEEEHARQLALEALSQRQATELAECEAPSEAGTASETNAMLELQKSELRMLQEEVQRATQDLDSERARTRLRAEDAELQLLEEAEEQRQAKEALQQERAFIERQKRSMLAMQAATRQMMESPDSVKDRFKQDGTFSCATAKLDEDDAGPDEEDLTLTGDGEEDADSEIWDLDWTELSRTNQTQESGETCDDGESALPADGDHRGVPDTEEAKQSGRLRPGQAPEEPEDAASSPEGGSEDITSPPRPTPSSSTAAAREPEPA